MLGGVGSPFGKLGTVLARIEVTIQLPRSTTLPGLPMTVIFTVLTVPFSVPIASRAATRSAHVNGAGVGGVSALEACRGAPWLALCVKKRRRTGLGPLVRTR